MAFQLQKRRKSSANVLSVRASALSVVSGRASQLSTARKSSSSTVSIAKDSLSYAEFFNILQQSRILSNEEGSEESVFLKNIYDEMFIKSATTVELISRHTELVSQVDPGTLMTSGMIRYIIGRVENSICVYLKNVELTPRDGKDS